MNAAVLPYLYQEELYRFSSPFVVVLARDLSSYEPDQQEMFKRILKSITSLDQSLATFVESVTILANPSVTPADLQHFNPTHVLAFGVDLPAGKGYYEPATAHGFTAIRAHDLDQFDDQKKKDLWAALRKVFEAKGK